MPIAQSRRRFVTNFALAGAAGLAGFGAAGRAGGGSSLAAEPPPEINTVRIDKAPIACLAPEFVAEELLHAEGFTDIRYLVVQDGTPVQGVSRGVCDWTLEFAPAVISELDKGAAVTMVSGVHVGCFELFAHEHVRSLTDLKGRTVGVPTGYSTPRHLVSIMASYVGLDPERDIHWVSDPAIKPMDLFVDRKIDAFLASAPRTQELRARNIGHSLVNSATDRPWSDYFCCMLTGRTEFV
jgi:NitT/TauT family transport system substrate-binding protein